MYTPQEDSFFFSEFLSAYFSKLNKSQKQKLKFLDMGCGSGILPQTAYNSRVPQKNIVAADIDVKSVNYTKSKLPNAKVIKSNLFSSPQLKNKKFDIITFNAPYLPREKTGHDNKPDTTGGKNGDETALEFLKHAKKHLAQKGKIFLLISSLTPQDKIQKFNPKILATKKIWFEKLMVLEIN